MNRLDLIQKQHLIKARIETTEGAIELMLDAWRAPKSVNRFLELIQDDFYVNKIIHRVLPDYIIQGGGHDVDEPNKESAGCQKYEGLENESYNGLFNSPGTIGMARNNYPDSARTQFYINISDNWISNATAENPGYTVFGYVTAGMDIVTKISHREAEAENPLEPIIIKSVFVDEDSTSSEFLKEFKELREKDVKEDIQSKEVHKKFFESGADSSEVISDSFGSESQDLAQEVVSKNEEQQRIRKEDQNKIMQKANQTAEDMLKKFTNNNDESLNKTSKYQEI